MSAYTGAIYTGPVYTSGFNDAHDGESYTFGAGTTTTTITFYTMRAVDNNAGTTPPTYRSWRVPNEPDYDASEYDGPYSGPSINFSSISIIGVKEITQ